MHVTSAPGVSWAKPGDKCDAHLTTAPSGCRISQPLRSKSMLGIARVRACQRPGSAAVATTATATATERRTATHRNPCDAAEAFSARRAHVSEQKTRLRRGRCGARTKPIVEPGLPLQRVVHGPDVPSRCLLLFVLGRAARHPGVRIRHRPRACLRGRHARCRFSARDAAACDERRGARCTFFSPPLTSASFS
jgi:hypothetical protein